MALIKDNPRRLVRHHERIRKDGTNQPKQMWGEGVMGRLAPAAQALVAIAQRIGQAGDQPGPSQLVGDVRGVAHLQRVGTTSAKGKQLCCRRTAVKLLWPAANPA
jgi:hypothetical protein